MKTVWTKGLAKDEAQQVEDAFNGASLMRLKLVEILEQKYDSCDKSSLAKANYDSPNWAFVKADEVGYKRCIQEILSLLK